MESLTVRSEAVSRYLLSLGLVTPEAAAVAAVYSRANGERFTTALVLAGGVAGDTLMRSLLRLNGEEYVEVDGYYLQAHTLHLIPEALASEFKILPIHRAQNVLFAAVPPAWSMSDDLAQLEKKISLHVEPIPVEEADVPGLVVKGHRLLKARSFRERRIGQALVERGLLTSDQLLQGLALQKRRGGRLGRALINLGFVTDRQLYQVLSERLGIPLLDSERLVEKVTPSVARKVTESFAVHNMILPFGQEGDTLKVACTSSCDPNIRETLKAVTGCKKIEFFLVDEAALRSILGSVFSDRAPLRPAADEPAAAGGTASPTPSGEIRTEVEVSDVQMDTELAEYDTAGYTDPQVPAIINYMLYEAVKRRVSDIHIEHYENRAEVKFRIDGQLRLMNSMPVTIENVIRVISKLKIDAKLDIAERRKPQDGSFRKRFGKKQLVDFRLAVQPTLYGENAVLRVLDRSVPLPTLPQLGMPEDMMQRYLRLIGNPQGMIVFTGPTGSGKTTTLYCTLDILRKQSLKIITAEDPIEYQFDGIQQCQVHEQIGNTFAKYLRGFLRQDPDVILIGEIRDQETAVMATRAAVTGHLLFTTIHATDSVGVIRRIVDMGVDTSMLSMSILAVVYQRLLRRICTGCKMEHRENPKVLQDLQLEGVLKDVTLYKGAGCETCGNEGYSGRVGVYEYWEPNEEARDLISKDPEDRKIRHAAFAAGLKPIVVNALQKIRDGVTTLAELQEVVPYNQIVRAKEFLK